MKKIQCRNDKGMNLFTQAYAANNLMDRIRGYMFYKVPPYEALLIDPCQSIHTFFMRFPIHVIYLNKQNKVIRVYEQVKPCRMTMWKYDVAKILEIACNDKNAKCPIKKDEILFFEDACID